MTQTEKIKAAKKIAGAIISSNRLERQIYEQLAYNGIDWAIKHTQTDLMATVDRTNLSEKDKALIKGVFYSWIECYEPDK